MPANPYDPELRRIRWIPRFSWTPTLVRLVNRASIRTADPGPDVHVDEIEVSPTTSIRLIRPAASNGPLPVLLWMHGGGHLIGAPQNDDRTNIAFVRELGIAVAAVRYRRGIDAPAPASVEDCYSALQALVERSGELGTDPARIAIGGASAGGGVAAGLTLYAHDRGEIPVAFQLLVYPMLDDRTVIRTDHDTSTARVWMPGSNRYGWATYLGAEPGSDGIPAYAAPARREDLAGLPPTWIGVGTEDLFYEEDVDYGRRLAEAGVLCHVEVVPGAFHGFDALYHRTEIARRFWQHQADALRAAGISSRA